VCSVLSSFTDSARSHGTQKENGQDPLVLSDGVGVYPAEDSLILTSVYFIIRHAIARRSEIRATIYKLIEKRQGQFSTVYTILYKLILIAGNCFLYIVDAQRAQGGTGGNRNRHATPLWAASVILGIFFRINAICYRKMAIG
jgi:hypothetical protein